MPSTTRRRRLLPAITLAALLLLALASPALATSTVDAPASPIDWVLDWWAQLFGPPGSTNTSASSTNTSVPNLEPNGNELLPPVLSVVQDGDETTIQDEGEIAPNLDPNG